MIRQSFFLFVVPAKHDFLYFINFLERLSEFKQVGVFNLIFVNTNYLLIFYCIILCNLLSSNLIHFNFQLKMPSLTIEN